MKRLFRAGVRQGIIKAIAVIVESIILAVFSKFVKDIINKGEKKHEKETTDNDADSSVFRPSWLNF